MYGKNPPKDLLAKSQKIVMKAQEKLENLQEQYDIAKDSWKYDLEAKNSDWRNKLDLKYQEFLTKEGLLKEKVRHMKQDVAATQKEIIKEKTQKALLSSRSVIEGHIAELFPLFKKTKINPADLCAMIPTQPVDYVVFDGLFQKEVKAVTFVDVKKGDILFDLHRTGYLECFDNAIALEPDNELWKEMRSDASSRRT